MKFLVINCENSKAWSPIDFGDMFISNLKRDEDEWFRCNIAKGDPLPDDVMEYDGIVLTGSHFNCRDGDSLSWFESLCDLVRRISLVSTPKLFGGCFGCQVIAHALGGIVDKNPSGKFILKAETIVPNEFFSVYLNSSCEQVPLSFKIIVSHGDCVLKLPDSGVNLANSISCENEIYVCGNNKNILACQSHPEFEYGYAIKERIWPSVVDVGKRISPDEAVEAAVSFDKFSQESSKQLCSFISDFLRNKTC